MISPHEANGFLAVVYEMMERMTTTDRKWFIKALKLAKKSMDVNYPNGKPDEPVAVEPSKVELALPTHNLIVPGGNDGIITPK